MNAKYNTSLTNRSGDDSSSVEGTERNLPNGLYPSIPQESKEIYSTVD